jgi:hypothetical protein
MARDRSEWARAGKGRPLAADADAVADAGDGRGDALNPDKAAKPEDKPAEKPPVPAGRHRMI